MIRESTEFFRLPNSYVLPKPGSEIDPADRDDNIDAFKHDESLGESAFLNTHILTVWEWSLMRFPIPSLPNPSFMRAAHALWCLDDRCRKCKGIEVGIIGEWERLFTAVNAKKTGTQYYRVIDLDVQLASLRETIEQIEEFIFHLGTPFKTKIDKKPFTVAEYNPPAENRKIQWPVDAIENLRVFIEFAKKLLDQAEIAKQKWGEEAALFIYTDL